MTELFTGATSFWLYATITLKKRSDASTLSVVLCNRPVLSSTTRVYPIIQEISGLGVRMGQYLPQPTSGSITLNNAPNSIGFERKFTDLLELYEIIDSRIAVTQAFNALGTETATTQVFYGRVLNGAIDLKSNTYQINFISAPVSTKEITRIVDSATFPDAPDESLGKYIPVVFGTGIDVKPIRISEDNAGSGEYATYAYATNFGGFGNSGAGVWVKDYDGKYKHIYGPGSTSSYIVDSSGSDYSVGLISYAESTSEVISISYTVLITSIKVRIQLKTFTRYGTLKVSVYEGVQVASGSWKPKELPIATASFDKANLVIGATNTTPGDLQLVFETPFLMTSDVGNYFVSFSQTENSTITADVDDVYIYRHLTSNKRYWFKDTLTTSREWTYDDSVPVQPIWYLYGPCFTDHPLDGTADTNGLGYSYMHVAQLYPVTNQVPSKLDGIDYLFKVDGIYNGGAVVRPDNVATVLGQEWNGATWASNGTGDGYNSANYSSYQGVLVSGTYYREFRGAFQSRTTVADAFATLCENCACRLVQASSGGFGLVPWGYEIPTYKSFSDETARLISVEQRGVETIVNDVRFKYKKTLENLSVEQGAASREFKNYKGSISRNSTTGTATDVLSQAIFGTKPNARSTYDFINDDTSALLLTAYLCATFQFPHWYVTFRAPLKDNYGLQLFHVVGLGFPELPSYTGTTPYYGYGGVTRGFANEAYDISGTGYQKRFTTYRGVVEAKEIDYNASNTPEVVVTCRLLLNPDDPT